MQARDRLSDPVEVVRQRRVLDLRLLGSPVPSCDPGIAGTDTRPAA